jgi:hypothetical protein
MTGPGDSDGFVRDEAQPMSQTVGRSRPATGKNRPQPGWADHETGEMKHATNEEKAGIAT